MELSDLNGHHIGKKFFVEDGKVCLLGILTSVNHDGDIVADKSIGYEFTRVVVGVPDHEATFLTGYDLDGDPEFSTVYSTDDCTVEEVLP